MRSSQFRLRWLGSVAVISFMCGCSSPVVEIPAEPCTALDGRFAGEFVRIGGTCAPDYEPPELRFVADDPPSTTITQTRFTETITTEFLRQGCQLDLKQTITRESDNSTSVELQGSLFMDSATEISGTIGLTEYEEDGSTPRCSATYEAIYTQKDVIVVEGPAE